METQMTRFNNILLISGTILNTDVIYQTAAMADPNGAELKLLQFSDALFDHRPVLVAKPLNGGTVMRSHLQDASDAFRPFENLRIRVQYKALKGDSQQVINRELDRDQHDLVVVDGSHSNVLLSHKFTTMAMHLLRQSALPVLVSRPAGSLGRMGIMAAIDPLESSGAFAMSGNALDAKIMALANAVALNLNQKIHIVNCWRHPMTERMRHNRSLSDAAIDEKLLEARDQQQKWLTQFLEMSSVERLRYRVHLRQGNPKRQIPIVARDHQIDLVIMGSFSRSGLDGIMIGNTAEHLLCKSNMSILVVKPSGYQPVSTNAITPAEAACQL
jgi:nucleotide-binding universal stress UspA family protein